MAYITHAMPELEVHGPHSKVTKRKPVRLPGMQPEKAKHLVQYSDEFVLDVILQHLRGASESRLSEKYEININTIRQWCNGQSRNACLRKAERIWRRQLQGA